MNHPWGGCLLLGDAKMFGKANSPKKGNGEKNEVTFSEARVPKMSY